MSNNLQDRVRLRTPDSLTRRASLNSIAALLELFARIAVSFVVTPILVGYLGNHLYGVWRVLQRVAGYFGPGGGRPLNKTLRSVIANRQSSNDDSEKRQCVGSSVVVWLLYVPLKLTVGAVLVLYLPDWLQVAPHLTGAVRAATAILVLQLVFTGLTSVSLAVLEGENLGYKVLGRSVVMVVLGGVLTFVAVRRDWGLSGIAAVALINTVLTGLVILFVVRTQVKWFGISLPSREMLHRFLGLNWWFLSWRFLRLLMTTSDFVLLGVVASAELVAVYALTRQVPDMIVSLTGSLVGGVMPGMGRIIGGGELRRAEQLRGELMLLTWIVTTAMGATLLLWNESFLNLWVGPGHYAGSSAMLLIVVMVMQFVVLRNDGNLIDLTLDLRPKVLLAALSVGVSITLAIFLIQRLEDPLVGLCWGWIAGRAILSATYPLIVGRKLEITVGAQVRCLVRPALLSVLVFWLLLRSGFADRASSWTHLVFASTTTFALVALVLFYGGLSATQRKRILARLSRIA